MTNKYEGIFLKLSLCNTLTEILEVFEAHREQADEEMLSALILDDRFGKIHVDILVGVIKAKSNDI